MTTNKFQHNVQPTITRYRHVYGAGDHRILETLDDSSLELLLGDLHAELDSRNIDIPLPSPTQQQLENNVPLAEAYNTLALIMKLQGLL